MAQYLPLPDGTYLKLQEGESPDAGLRRAQQKYPEAFASAKPAAQPQSGFLPALKAGATELGGGIAALAGKLGLKDEAKAQAEYDAAKKRAAEIFKPTEEGWTEAPVTKFKELLGGSLPYMAAPLAAGAAAAALPVTGTAAALTTLGAAGLTSAGQFTATNLARQMEEGKKLADTELGSAALASVPMALLDTLSMRMIPGIGRMFGQAGVKITAENAKEIAEQGLKKTLIDYTAKTGKTAGIEGATEAAQQVFERLQAGLNITDEKARQEYFDSFLGGAVLGGTLAPAGRYVERGREQREARGLLQGQAAEERKTALAAEEAKKKSPEYLLDLEARYQAAMQKKAQLDAAIVKPPKGADPATMIAYRDAVRARDEFAKTEMAEVAREYATRKKEIDALGAQRQQEAELAAQEVPQAEQKLPYYESAQGTIPGLEAVETPVIEEEAPVDYARQVRLLKQQLEDIQTQAKTTTDLATKLQLSKSYAQTQEALADAQKEAKAEGKGGIEALRKQMATAESAGDLEVQGKLAQQLLDLGVTDLGAQAELDLGRPQALGKLQVPSDMADYQAAQQRAAEAKAAREAQQRQQQQLAKEAYERSLQTADMYSGVAAAAQRRAADRAAAEAETKTETERTQREEEMVGKLVQATGAVQPQPVPQARMALPTGETTESLYDQATELRAQLSFAQQTRNKNLEARVQQQLQQIGASTEEKGTALDLGATAREAGVEGELTPDAMEQNRLTRLAQRQLMSYDQLVKFITQAREREQTTVDEKTKAQYKYRAEQLKQAAIGFALQEINGRRQQYGLPVLEHKEAMRAVTGLARPLNELIARGAQIFEEPVVVRGQQRGIRLVEGAQEFERPPAGKRTFSEAGFPAAADTLREQFRKTVETVSGVPAAPAAAPFGKPPGPVRKVVPEQRELFLTPPPAEEPVSLAPTALLDKAADKAASADDARLLRQMQEVYTQLTSEQQSVVREQAQRAADGKPLDAVYEMRGLYQLQQREAATAAGQQTFLKPITLVTARRKIERLAQQAAALEKDLREKLQALIRTGITRGIPELEQQLKDVGLKAASKVETKTPVEQAQATLDRALRQGKDLVDAAQKIKTDQFQEIAKFSSYVYTPLLEKQQQISREWDAAVAEFTEIQTQYDYFRAEFDAGRAPKANRAELAALTSLIPKTADRVVTVSKQLDNINALVVTAESTIASIRERQAADTVVGPLLKDAAKAKTKIDAAQKKLGEARAAEESIERGHKLLLAAAAPKTVTPLEQIEALPITGVTRVFRDTSDPAVQAQATKKRSAIAREEGTYAILEERLKTAEGDDKVNLQRQLNESEARLQKLHTELYDVYGNAPLKRVQGTTVEAAASAERLEKAQHAVHDAEIDAFNAKHDTARLSLPPRKAGPMISERGVVKQGGERVIKAEPATPIADIVSTRKRIDEINQQFAYLKDNPAKSAEGKAKQAKVKTQLAAERQTLAAKLKALLKQQTQVRREEKAIQEELGGAKKVSKGSIRRSKLEATDAQLFEDLAKATKTKEQTLLFERAENAFGEMSAPEQAFVRRQANAVVGRREADYKGAQLAEVVAAAERRMAREGVFEFGPQEKLFARGVESETPDLDAEQVKAIEANDVGQALALLGVDKTADPVHRAVAKQLAKLLDKTSIKIKDDLRDDKGQPILGQASTDGKEIELDRNTGLTQEVLLHEATHAAAERVLLLDEARLTPMQLAAKRELQNIHARIKTDPDITSTDAKGSLSEFVAEVMSNATLQQQLAKKPWSITSMLNGFKSAILRVLGIKEAKTMLTASMQAVDALFTPTSVQTAPVAKTMMPARAAPAMATANRVADNLIAKEKGIIQNLKDNFLGMGFRAQFVDKLAPVEEAFKKGGIGTTKALQAMYYLRMYDQRMHFTSQAISDGVPEIVEKARKDGGTERLIETKPGANISQVVDILKKKDVVKAAGSADGANRLFTLYLAAIRAERVGMDALNFGGTVTEADLKAARAEIEANDTLKNAFDEARDIYNQYNRNLIEFAVQTGALSKSEAKALLASNDYIPYYRVKDGVAQLIVGKETPIRIGNLKDSPHLKELVGGDEAIFDFLTSSVQNTAMLLDMSMKNLATKNAMFELRDVGLATVSKVPKSGKTPEGAVTFKRDGEDHFAVVDTDTLGIDSDLLVKGLAGIPTMFPSFVRVLGIPARFLRRVVVASPVYMARQLFRDSLAASMTSGADLVPVLDSLKQIGKPKALGARGITGGQVFTGMPEDVTRMLKDMQAGKVSVTSGLAWLEAKSAQADALTREAQYQSYLKQGLSEMEATYMALESMNFSKRGLSPTMHMVSTLIPFFNAQIQGLDVLYKAFTGQMPMNERLAIREKLWTRGMLLAGMSVAYAMAMQDEEEYKNARPEEKYGNWFVKVPGFDESLRLPIPFELGYVFKALPEAVVNILSNEEGGTEAMKAGKHIVQQMVPGLSNYFLPQAVKPALETILGTSIFTGRSIESAREQMEEPGFRYREGTTSELAKQVGELTGFSPVKMEYLIRGYTGGMGIALLQALSAPFGSSGPEAATKRLSDMPVIGTLFQPKDAGGIIDATYERMKQVNQVKETYEGLIEKGRTADAQKYIATRMDEMALASVAGSFREYMGQITEFERGIKASSMTPEQKREKLDQARQMKIRLAESVRSIAGKTTPQPALA